MSATRTVSLAGVASLGGGHGQDEAWSTLMALCGDDPFELPEGAEGRELFDTVKAGYVWASMHEKYLAMVAAGVIAALSDIGLVALAKDESHAEREQRLLLAVSAIRDKLAEVAVVATFLPHYLPTNTVVTDEMFTLTYTPTSTDPAEEATA